MYRKAWVCGWVLGGGLMSAACEDSFSRQEVVTKLRGIGVELNPPVSVPSTQDAPMSVRASVVVALPPGLTASLEPYLPGAPVYSLPVLGRPSSDAPVIEDYGALRVIKFAAEIPVPTAESLALSDLRPAGTLRYGFRVTRGDDPEDVEKVEGDVVVAMVGHPSLAWQIPQARLISPEEGEVWDTGSGTIEAEVDERDDGGSRFGWFVDQGKVESRRALSTNLSSLEPGVHTIIFTVRGRQSRAFSYVVRDVVVEE